MSGSEKTWWLENSSICDTATCIYAILHPPNTTWNAGDRRVAVLIQLEVYPTLYPVSANVWKQRLRQEWEQDKQIIKSPSFQLFSAQVIFWACSVSSVVTLNGFLFQVFYSIKSTCITAYFDEQFQRSTTRYMKSYIILKLASTSFIWWPLALVLEEVVNSWSVLTVSKCT